MKINLIKDINLDPDCNLVDEMLVTKDTFIMSKLVPHEDSTKRKQIVILRNPNRDVMRFEIIYE
jgi:microcystin degradation protein MlrC